jgi:hypothetical protein
VPASQARRSRRKAQRLLDAFDQAGGRLPVYSHATVRRVLRNDLSASPSALASLQQRPARVIVCADPFDLFLDPAKIREVKEDETLADMAPNAPGHWLCLVDSDPIPKRLWHHMPPPGKLVQFRCLPAGGGKDNGGSLRAVLTIVAMIAITIFTAGAATGFALQALRFGLQLAATALINNLIPVEGPKSQSGSPQYSAQVQGNVARLGAPIPEIFGFDNGFPELASQPYSIHVQTGERSIHTEQYLHVLLMVGSGQYHICRVSVGDTDITSFEEAEIIRIGPNQSTLDGPGTGVEDIADQTLVDPLWINSPDVTSIEMRPQEYAGPYAGCPPERTIDRVRIGTMLPKGLVQESGMSWRVEARLIDDFDVPLGPWETIGEHTETDESNVPVRMHKEYELTPGRYQFQKYRTDGTTNPNLAELDQLDWLDLQGHLVDADISVTNCTFIAIKVRATGQLSGGLRFRVMSRRMLPIYEGSPPAWSDPQLTRSPAWAFAQVLRSRGVPDANIDLDALMALAPIWEARYDSFDYKFDTQTSTWEALALIAKVGRAVPLIRGSRYTVVRDGPETLPVAAYGMRNIVRGSMSLSPTLAASDSMRTLDAEYWDHRRWNWITVTSQIHDGEIYTYRGEVERAALGIPAPDENRRGRIKLSGIIGENHAKRTVAYTLADAYYRSASVEFDTELDGQLPAPLNLVLFQHDVGDFGQGGDIVSISGSTVETTEPLQWSDGAHAMRLQKPDGSLTSAITVTPGADDFHAVLGSAAGFTPSTEDADRERTRYVFGPQTQVGALCKVRSITPSDERKFGLRLVLEDDRVHTVDAAFIADDPLPPCDVIAEPEPGYRYWRLYITANDGDFTYTSMSQLRLLDSGTNILAQYVSSPAQSSESSSNGSFETAFIICDESYGGQFDTEWVTAAGQPIPSWVAFDVGAERSIQSYAIRSQRIVTGRTPTAWELQVNNESMLPDAPWVTLDSNTSTSWGLLEQRTFSIA